jgi:hypothetical protein
MRAKGRLLTAASWAVLAAFAQGSEAPRLGYERSAFRDACLAPDFLEPGCRSSEPAKWGGEGLSASAALLPADGEAPSLRYQLAALLDADSAVTYRQPRARPDR